MATEDEQWADPDSPRGLGAAASTLGREAPVRTPLDRRSVIVAGIQLIEEEGLRELSMRRLGARLGVEGMALYRHVRSRDDLLDGIVDAMMDDLYGDPDVLLESDNWRDYLQRLGHGVRRIAYAHPQVFPLLTTRPPAAPWLWPPLRSLRWADSFLANLRRAGFSGTAAAEAYRSFSSFLMGTLLLQVSGMGADTAAVEQADPDKPAEADLTAFPYVAELQHELSEDFSDQEFEEALEALVDRLEVTMHRHRRRR